MASQFSAIAEDFSNELEAIQTMVATHSYSISQSRVRIASTNAAILLLAAVYEEFIRQMAEERARNVANFPKNTKRLRRRAWKTTFDGLSRVDPFGNSEDFPDTVRNIWEEKVKSLFAFMTGDFGPEILQNAIRNERHMRPWQLNEVFRLSGVDEIARKICEKKCLINHLDAGNPEVAHGRFLKRQHEFFDRRNEIAHSFNSRKSVAVEVVVRYIELFGVTSQALKETLNGHP